MAKTTSGFARVTGAQPALPSAHIIAVEVDVVKGLHAFTVVGLPDKAVEEAKDRVASAIKNSGLHSPKASNKKIVVSLAPAELKKEGAAFDVPFALGYLLASQQIQFNPEKKLFAGELSLDGDIRPIRGALSIAAAAKARGIEELYLPRENCAEAALVGGITLYPIESLEELLKHVVGSSRTKPFRVTRTNIDETDAPLDEIRGQESAKRALEIAAAGRHNIALYGPPGTGKTMLARATSALLPRLREDEAIEVTSIHSIAGVLAGAPLFRAPFRSPHHTSSYASLIGGGTTPRPGEVTLAHRGVLFLDEFPEFHRDVVNALREPLEDRLVSVSRAKGSAVYPANFMLIAALNPCPCGFWGSSRCTCMPHLVEKYRRKISGPIADRIDMWVTVPEMPPESLARGRATRRGETAAARARIEKARDVQERRFKNTKLTTNADMRAKDIESLASLSDEAEKALIDAAKRLHLSARGYHRTIKLARTIADLAGETSIEPSHMLEALQYRSRDF